MNQPRPETSYPRTGTTRRLIAGGFFSFLGRVLTSLKQILLVPLFLTAWGKVVYGEWLTIFALVSYLPLVEVGMHNYIANLLTRAYARGRKEEYLRTFQSGLLIYLAIITVFGALFAGLVLRLPIHDWLRITRTTAPTVRLTALLLGGNLLLSLLAGLVTGLYHSQGEYPRHAMLVNGRQAAMILLVAGGLLLRFGFAALASIYLLVTAGFIGLCLIDLKRRGRLVELGFRHSDWKTALSFIAPGSLFLLITLTNVIKIHGSVLVINAILGAAMVAVFSVHRVLGNAVKSLVGMIYHVIWPELTAAESRRDEAKLRAAFFSLLKLSLFTSFTIAVFLGFYGGEIIGIWTAGRIEFHPLLWFLIICYLPWNGLWEASGIFFLSTNRHRGYAWLRFASTAVAIPLAILLTSTRAGIAGTMAAFIAAEMAFCGLTIPAGAMKMVGASRRQLWIHTVGKGLMVAAGQILLAGLVARAAAGAPFWARWAAVLAAIGAGGGLLAYRFWLTTGERVLLARGRRQLSKRGRRESRVEKKQGKKAARRDVDDTVAKL